MAARLVSSMSTILDVRGCSSRYFFTVFFDSPTLMARTIKPLSPNSWFSLSTMEASCTQYWHQVVQKSRRTTLPLMEVLLNFSPVVVVALKRGAGSLSLGSLGRADKLRATKIKIAQRALRKGLVREGIVGEMYHKSNMARFGQRISC